MSRTGESPHTGKLADAADLERAKADQRKNGGRLGESLVRLGLLKEHELVNILSKQYGIPAVNLESFEIDPESVKHVPRSSYTSTDHAITVWARP